MGYVPGAGTSADPRTYRFRSEPLPDGLYRLRAKQVRFDGGFAYSPEVEVVVGNPVLHTLGVPRPSPTREAAHVGLRLERAQQVRAVLYDALGRRVAVLHDGPVEADRRMGPAGLTHGQLVVEEGNEPMRYFVEDHLVRFGYLSGEAEIRASGKRLT